MTESLWNSNHDVSSKSPEVPVKPVQRKEIVELYLNAPCDSVAKIYEFASLRLLFYYKVITRLISAQVYGGVDITSPLLLRLCHSQTEPQSYVSAGNDVVFQFVSDISNTGRGFNATYRTIDAGAPAPSPTHTHTHTHGGPEKKPHLAKVTITA